MRMSIAFLHNRFLFLASYILLLTLFFFESAFIIFWFFIFFLVHLNKWATYHVNLLSAILLWICNVVWIINKIIYKYISSFILIISSLQLSFFLFDFAVTLYTFSLLLRNHFSHYLIHACKHFSGYSLRGHFLNRSYFIITSGIHYFCVLQDLKCSHQVDWLFTSSNDHFNPFHSTIQKWFPRRFEKHLNESNHDAVFRYAE